MDKHLKVAAELLAQTEPEHWQPADDESASNTPAEPDTDHSLAA